MKNIAKLSPNTKGYHYSRIYNYIRENGNITRKDIQIALDLSLPTITQDLLDMMDRGLIYESGYLGYTGGRKATTYSIVKDARMAIGVDITTRHITAVAVDLMGNVTARVNRRRNFERTDSYYKYLGEVIEETIEDSKIDRKRILGVGIGVPGLTTADNSSIYYGKILNITGATVEEFSRYINFPTIIHNDANAACFAEVWVNKEIANNAFYIMLSDNVSGSIFINKKVYQGDDLRSGEVGHIPIHLNGKRCFCGQRGCVNAYCSAAVLFSISGGDIGHFFDMLEGDDPKALLLWDEYLDDLAITVSIIRLLFDCQIILGGYVGSYMDKYLDDFREKVKLLNPFDTDANYVTVCKYKRESISAGAALTFISEFINSI